MTRVGTAGGAAPARTAAVAVSARANQVSTSSTYTPGRKRDSMAIGPAGRVGAGWLKGCVQQPIRAHASDARGSRRRLSALQTVDGRVELTGAARSPGNGSARRWAGGVGMLRSACAKRGGRRRAASHAACAVGPSAGPSATSPSKMVGRRVGWAGRGLADLRRRVARADSATALARSRFREAGYAAASPARDLPSASLPVRTSSCLWLPWEQWYRAAPRPAKVRDRSPPLAIVVHFCALAWNMHCEKVWKQARDAPSADAMQGMCHREPWRGKRDQCAGDCLSDRLAGFSSATGVDESTHARHT